MDLFSTEYGNGEPIIVLHGLYGSSDNWQPIAKALSEYSMPITVDLRNHGKSPKSDEHTYSAMASDLAELLLKKGISKAHFIGHSMGGKVAMLFAALFPQKVLSLTVADIAPIDYLENPASAIQYQFHRNVIESMMSVDLTTCNGRKDVDRELEPRIEDASLRHFLLKNLRRNANGQFEWKLNLRTLNDSLVNILSGGNIGQYPQLPVYGFPVFFVKGAQSDYIDDDGYEAITKAFPEAKICIMEGCTHLLHAEKPDEFVSVVKHNLWNR